MSLYKQKPASECTEYEQIRKPSVQESYQTAACCSEKKYGDIENQFMRLSNTVTELDKLVSELISRIKPILTPECSVGCSEKDCNKEELISPIGTAIRESNNHLLITKSKVIDALDRIQL